MLGSQLHFCKQLPPASRLGRDALLLCDRKLCTSLPQFKKWTNGFPAVYSVAAGEKLKNIDRFPAHIKAIFRQIKHLNPKKLIIVVVGGGSLGDFGGFVASILKRGLPLIHIPTTWLAAIDSCHGGKTALNVGKGKNQIGTFYNAKEIFIVKEILMQEPMNRIQEAGAELAKIALIDGRSWIKPLEKSGPFTTQLLWDLLPDAIESKMRIVRRDPFEKKGERAVLNLGHTLGHLLELSVGLPHGQAVAQGLFFSLDWSLRRGMLSSQEHHRANNLLKNTLSFLPLNETERFKNKAPRAGRAREILLQDKKRSSQRELSFVFLKGIGKPVRLSIPTEEILSEMLRQKWIRQ